MRTTLTTLILALVATAAFAGQFVPAAGERVSGQHIVVFRDDAPAGQVAHALAAAHGGAVAWTYRHALNGALVVGLSDAAARALAGNPNVRWVEEDGVVTLVSHVTSPQTNPPSWGLDRIDQRALPLDASYTFNFDGTGVDVFIIDTGIRETHVDFGGRASRDFDSVGDGQNGNDCNGHGTHVAGTAAGDSFGVAKNARIHAVRVLDCGGSGTFAGVIAGIDFVTQQAQDHPQAPNPPFVANMSLAGGANTSLDAAVDNSAAAGVFYAVAAANNAADACNFSPARAAQAYAVASSTITDARSSFSNFGTCVEIFGPGSSITSAWATSDTATNTISGTSMASPHVAGVAALVRSEFPAFTVSQVKQEVTARATCGVITNPGAGTPNLLVYSLSGTDPNCGGGPVCQPVGAACTVNSDCCSNKCRGRSGAKTCR
jgi:subtilisin family serine protease